jgi:hypothetical protein
MWNLFTSEYIMNTSHVVHLPLLWMYDFSEFCLLHFGTMKLIQKIICWPFKFCYFRRQKEEALNFRAKKENEVIAVEKVRIQACM